MDKKKLLWTAAVAFVLLAVLYFLPFDIPFKKSFPLAVLFIASFALQSWAIVIAMLCSLAGDLAGDLHQFVPQMGFFALAHLCFIGYFLSLGLKRKRAKEAPVKGWWFALVTLFAVALVYFASERIIPYAPEGEVRTGMYVYAGLIAVMMWSALMQRDWMWGVGAVLFVISDMILATTLFVTPVPGKKYLIMVPYYAAQLLIFVRSAMERQGWKRLICA